VERILTAMPRWPRQAVDLASLIDL